MPLELPSSLSPSKVTSFTDCALAFRFSAIDRIPQPPTVATVKGTLVHSALERLLALESPERTLDRAFGCLDESITALDGDAEWAALALDPAAHPAFFAEARSSVERYFQLEDPSTIEPIGLELQLETEFEGVLLRGIIDRLETDANGDLIVSDYKTGRAPPPAYQQARLGGVHFYALLCERVLGRRPARVQLLYLGDPVIVHTEPTDQSTRQLERKLRSIWQAIRSGCEREDFRPRRSKLCSWCSYQQWCPEFGGDPSQARIDWEAQVAAANAATAELTDGAASAVP